ncbi:uncharacterized protein LOC127863374 [Dreissena polymorpha]|uniref:FLYWCH-type domain-containing protein n=1 Tax=Dreissena polymorpha TaxID=45954 RepID=A0A9D3Y589_DREPO|nr:uncharacterized protein LOC127863374 [Dreissena polymorpha]KAH3692527.1 hypothetical protein DPMN_194369 [Dreissena polymorpha]
MEIIRSKRGSTKVCYEGYAYTKKKENTSTVRWECCKRRSHACTGALTTDFGITQVQIVCPHTHPEDHTEIEAMKVHSQIMAVADIGAPGQILDVMLAQYPEEIRAALGNTESLKRAIRRARTYTNTRSGQSSTEKKAVVDRAPTE